MQDHPDDLTAWAATAMVRAPQARSALPFSPFTVATVTGTVTRHFRDHQ
jgi:hypothetical protein